MAIKPKANEQNSAVMMDHIKKLFGRSIGGADRTVGTG